MFVSIHNNYSIHKFRIKFYVQAGDKKLRYDLERPKFLGLCNLRITRTHRWWKGKLWFEAPPEFTGAMLLLVANTLIYTNILAIASYIHCNMYIYLHTYIYVCIYIYMHTYNINNSYTHAPRSLRIL